MEKVLIKWTIKSNSLPDQTAEFHENRLSTTKKKGLEVIRQENYTQRKLWWEIKLKINIWQRIKTQRSVPLIKNFLLDWSFRE